MRIRFINKQDILDIEPVIFKNLKIINLGNTEVYEHLSDGKVDRIVLPASNFSILPTASQSDVFQKIDDFELPIPAQIPGYIFVLPNYYMRSVFFKDRIDCMTIIQNKLYLL